MREDVILREITDRKFKSWFKYEFVDEKGEKIINTFRDIMHMLNKVEMPEDRLDEISETINKLSEIINSLDKRPARTGFSETTTIYDDYVWLAHGPMIGKLNPLAPPVQLEEIDNKIVGSVRFGAAYEGPPGHVHGGYLAGVLDEVLGSAQTLSDKPGVTGTISVRYCAPTPINRDVRVEGTLDRIEGRKIFTLGKMFVDDQITAEATGVFITLKDTDYELLKDRAKGEGKRKKIKK